MEYIRRHAEESLNELAKQFSAVLVTGPRQVGKSTLLKKFVDNASYTTFDDPILLANAKSDSRGFLNMQDLPCVLDEVQYATELFPFIKMKVDESGEKGMYYLTGSQQFHLMKNVSESLAGRIGIVNLLGLSSREIDKDDCATEFLPTLEFLLKRKKTLPRLDSKKVWERIYQGCFPAVINGAKPEQFYSAYVKTYIERDVRSLTQVGDEMQFIKFITVVASRTSQMVNFHEIAGEVGISEPTAKKWLSILVTSGLVYLLQPYFTNISKRVLKTPKLYFLDTGLAAYLSKWTSSSVIESGAMSGAFFETYVVAEIIKSYYNKGLEPSISFYRDKEMREIDLLIEKDGTLYPVEIKKTASPNIQDLKHFKVLNEITQLKIGEGGVVCMCDVFASIEKDRYVIPVNYI